MKIFRFLSIYTFLLFYLQRKRKCISYENKRINSSIRKKSKRLIEIIYKAKAGHIGGDLSCLNVLTALYFDVMNVDAGNPKDNLRDRFILSKGHCVEALYVTLESRGFMAKGILDTLGQYGSILSGHPTIGVPGIEVNTGALGHGLSVGVGIAMAAKWIRGIIKPMC